MSLIFTARATRGDFGPAVREQLAPFGRAARHGHARGGGGGEPLCWGKQIGETQATRESFSWEGGSSGGMGWADEAVGVRVEWFQGRF